MRRNAPAGSAKRAAPAKKPRRRRRADAAPTTPSCQLMTRPSHCRFERFQVVRAERTDALRTLGESRPRPSLMRGPASRQPFLAHPAWRAAGKIIPTRSSRMESLGAFVKENKSSTKLDFGQEFSKPPADVTTRRRRGAAMAPASRGHRPRRSPTAAPGPENREFGFLEQDDNRGIIRP